MKIEKVTVKEKGTGNRPGIYRKTTYDIGFAVPIKKIPGWIIGDTYEVYVDKMWNGRYCIYKKSGAERHSGYKTYDTLRQLKEDFKTEQRTVMQFLEELPHPKKFQGREAI